TVDRARMREEARVVLAQLDFRPDPDSPVGALGFAERQLVAIGKALHRRCRVFILDEPTAALEKREIERLFAVLAPMKGQGTAILYLSHRLDEVVAIADRCTVLRDGRVAAVSARGAFSAHDLVAAMTGGAAEDVAAAPLAPGKVLLEAQPDGAATIHLRGREVVGLAGLLGSGAGGMLRRLFDNPAAAIAAAIGVPPEAALAVLMIRPARDNLLPPNLAALSRLGLLDRRAGAHIVAELMELVDIRPRRPELNARALSGGNQQKVILAKWLARRTAV